MFPCFIDCLRDYVTDLSVEEGVSLPVSALAHNPAFEDLRLLVSSDATTLCHELVDARCLEPAAGARERSTIAVSRLAIRSLCHQGTSSLPPHPTPASHAGRPVVSPPKDRPPAAASAVTADAATPFPPAAVGVAVAVGAVADHSDEPDNGASHPDKPAARSIRAFCTWFRSCAMALLACMAPAIWTTCKRMSSCLWSWDSLMTAWNMDPKVAMAHVDRFDAKATSMMAVIQHAYGCIVVLISRVGQWQNSTISPEPTPTVQSTSSATPATSASPTHTPITDATPADPTHDEPTPTTDTTRTTPAEPIAPDPEPSKPNVPGKCVRALCHLAALTHGQTLDVYQCAFGELALMRQAGPQGPMNMSAMPQRAQWQWQEVADDLRAVIPAPYYHDGLRPLVKCKNPVT